MLRLKLRYGQSVLGYVKTATEPVATDVITFKNCRYQVTHKNLIMPGLLETFVKPLESRDIKQDSHESTAKSWLRYLLDKIKKGVERHGRK